MVWRIPRRAAVLGPLMMALVLAAQPAAAAVVTSTTGKVGPYQINDEQAGPRGANCDYKTQALSNGQHLLKDISVRAPFVHARDTGPGNQSQWVGWQFKIDRDTNFDNVYANVFTSGIVKRQATETTIAPFSRRTWTPATKPKGNFRVRISIYWYTHSGATKVTGRVNATIEWYHVRGGGPDTVRQTNCYRSN